MKNQKVVSKQEWITARKEFLIKEKEFTRKRDQLNKERRQPPWVKVEQPYLFSGKTGGRNALGFI